jgi:hypothetical protein
VGTTTLAASMWAASSSGEVNTRVLNLAANLGRARGAGIADADQFGLSSSE